MLKVLSTGLYSTVQDLGRYGFKQYGVPISGAMDQFSAQLANNLLGNDLNAAVLEMTMIGPVLEFHCTTQVCITGANMFPSINSTSIPLTKAITVKNGDVLSFKSLKEGYRSYLAVLGGLQTDSVMGSRSMYKNITTQETIIKGQELYIKSTITAAPNRNANFKLGSHDNFNVTLEVFKGPEFDLLSEDIKTNIFLRDFTVSKNNNRMAYQLEELLENDLNPIITSMVLPGTVQLTPSGRLIVLMRDCQTTGGYPRVLQLTESAINKLSQKYIGQKLRFQQKI